MRSYEATVLLQKYVNVVDEICGVLAKYKVEAKDGQRMLLLIAGMSAGNISMKVTELLPPLLIGWALGATEERG